MVVRRVGARARVGVIGVGAALVSAFLVGTAVPGGSAEKSQQDPKGVFHYYTDTTAVHWDPIKAASSGALWATSMFVYKPLMRGVLDGPPQPGLATKIDIVDPSTLDITLRKNVKFSDGTPVTPDAVKQTLERNKAAANQVPIPGSLRADTKLMDTITVTGPNTLEVKLSQPQARTFFPVLTGVESAVISPKALGDGTDLDTTPVGA